MLKHLLKTLHSSLQQFEFLHSLNESIALLNFTRQIKHTFYHSLLRTANGESNVIFKVFLIEI